MNETLLIDFYNLANLAKTCHWNVSGPMFEGLHSRFDKIFEESLELGDRIGERMRFLDMKPNLTPDRFQECEMLDITENHDTDAMLRVMIRNLEIAIEDCESSRSESSVDNTIIDDLEEWCGKQIYFLKSSVS